MRAARLRRLLATVWVWSRGVWCRDRRGLLPLSAALTNHHETLATTHGVTSEAPTGRVTKIALTRWARKTSATVYVFFSERIPSNISTQE
jgi:hypothetical protein